MCDFEFRGVHIKTAPVNYNLNHISASFDWKIMVSQVQMNNICRCDVVFSCLPLSNMSITIDDKLGIMYIFLNLCNIIYLSSCLAAMI